MVYLTSRNKIITILLFVIAIFNIVLLIKFIFLTNSTKQIISRSVRIKNIYGSFIPFGSTKNTLSGVLLEPPIFKNNQYTIRLLINYDLVIHVNLGEKSNQLGVNNTVNGLISNFYYRMDVEHIVPLLKKGHQLQLTFQTDYLPSEITVKCKDHCLKTKETIDKYGKITTNILLSLENNKVIMLQPSEIIIAQ